MTAITTTRELTGKHVFLICLAFFGVMLAANSIFVVCALTTLGGGEGGKAYQKGLDYNRVIEAAKAQDALGWSHAISAGMGGRVSVTLKDASGAPLSGLAIDGEIARPVDDRFTRPLAFSETGPGVYAAEAGGLDAGNWVVALTAIRPRDRTIVYRAKERLWLKPNS